MSKGIIRDAHFNINDSGQAVDSLFLNLPAIGGNSGSAILNNEGDIIGIYTFGLKVRNDLDGQIVEGLERTIVIIANDNFDEEDNTLIVGVENDFIPNIFAPESVVITMGSNLTLPSRRCRRRSWR